MGTELCGMVLGLGFTLTPAVVTFAALEEALSQFRLAQGSLKDTRALSESVRSTGGDETPMPAKHVPKLLVPNLSRSPTVGPSGRQCMPAHPINARM
jgi:hypothetical protein